MRRTLLVALALLPACAPTQRRLLAGKHYAEATCAVSQAAADPVAVARAIEADLELGLHVQVASPAQVEALVGSAAARLQGHALVRVFHDANTVPLERMPRVRVALARGEEIVPPVPALREALAAITGEISPPPQALAASPTSPRIGPWALVTRLAANLMTLGLIYPLAPIFPDDPAPGPARTIPADEVDFRRAAPAAAALVQQLAPETCPQANTGETCRAHALWPRPADEAGALRLVVALELGACEPLVVVHAIDLPPGPTLEARLQALFGDRVVRLADLPQRAPRVRARVPVEVAGDEPGPTARASRSLRSLARRVAGRPGLQVVIVQPARPGDDAAPRRVEAVRRIFTRAGVPDRAIRVAAGPEGQGLAVLVELGAQ